MSRTKETLSHPEAVEVLADSTADPALRQAAHDRVELTLQDGDANTVRDLALDLLSIVHPEC